LNRPILVLAAVSSTNTSRAGSNMPCSRIQRLRARATSARSCSAARRLFFESDLVTLEEAPHRGATARNFVLAHRQNDLIQRQIRLLLDQTQQKIRMLLQWRDAPAPRLGRAAASLAKALDLDNRCAGADLKLFGYLPPRSSALHLRYHSLPHVPRIGLRHPPPPQSESMPIDSLILGPLRIPRFNRGGTCSRSTGRSYPWWQLIHQLRPLLL